MRIGKILVIVVGSVVALVVVVLAAVWLLVNPNEFKPRITAQVKAATGRDLTLNGDIKLSVFPWIALNLGPASLGNPPGFPDQPFVAFNSASVRVKLLPLLSKRLEIGRIEVDGLDLKLLKNAEGKGNWQDFGKSTSPPAGAAPDTSEPAAAKHGGSGEALEGVAGVKVTHARLSYEKFTVENIDLETGSFSDRGVMPITLHFDANRGTPNESAKVDAQVNFGADTEAEKYSVQALNLVTDLARATNTKPLHLAITSPSVMVDMKAQTLAMPSFAVSFAGADLNGGVQATKILDDPAATGTVSLAPLVLREFAERLGVTLPATRDPKALSALAVTASFAYGGNAANLPKLEVTLDDTHLTGSAAVTNLETHALMFDLAVDGIDADRYLPPPTQTAPTPPSPTATGEPSAPIEANGTLSVGKLHFAPLDLSAVKVTVAAKDKVIHVFPLRAELDSGEYTGDITLDSRAATPVISMDEHLKGIDVGKLMASETKKLKLSGRGDVDIKATGHGNGADALMKTLNGHFDLNVANGAVEGMDLGYQIARAEALLKRQEAGGQDTKRTKFDTFKMSAEIVNGIATTRDLDIASPVAKVTGQGSANLPTEGLDMTLLADTGKMAGNLQIPIKVTGTFADPTLRPDVEALAKGALGQKAKDLVQDKLKGLFK